MRLTIFINETRLVECTPNIEKIYADIIKSAYIFVILILLIVELEITLTTIKELFI